MSAWEYKSVPITLHRSGEFQIKDFEVHKQVMADEGWEYIDFRVLAEKHADVAEVILRFRKRKSPGKR
jgi:hypothetical protein